MDKKELLSMIEIQLKSFIDSKRPKDQKTKICRSAQKNGFCLFVGWENGFTV